MEKNLISKKSTDTLVNHLLLPFVEIEIRLGTLSKSFDSSINKKYFFQIKEDLLLNKNVFKNIENINTVEYINNKLKLIKGTEDSLIMKENVLTKTFSLNLSPFDIRLSINQEFSLNSYISLKNETFHSKDVVIRKKERTSFIDLNYRYDLTIVNETINNIQREKYEIEIELLINKETLTWSNNYINDFIECKIYDLINIVEPIDRDTFKINLSL